MRVKKRMGRPPTVSEEARMIGRNITFPRLVLRHLEEEAARREITVSELVRQAVARELAHPEGTDE